MEHPAARHVVGDVAGTALPRPRKKLQPQRLPVGAVLLREAPIGLSDGYSKFFYCDDALGRRLQPDRLTGAEAGPSIGAALTND
jgi:hypothetical protein